MVNLILPKCKPNLRTIKGQTALTLAAIKNHANIVRALITSDGVDIDAPDSDGNTALHLMCQSGV